MKGAHLVIGLGEIGKPLRDIISAKERCLGLDLEPQVFSQEIEVLHICYPYQIKDFVKTTLDYIGTYHPQLVMIHSTVVPGTTRAIANQTSVGVAYSPIRGKHAHMRDHIQFYTKYVAALSDAAAQEAVRHLKNIGLKTRIISRPEILELAKLSETTYLGVLISWAQELERYCLQLDAHYDEVVSFFEEIPFFPQTKFFPGFIGGHCVIPNILLLKQKFQSKLLDAILDSNEQKRRESP